MADRVEVAAGSCWRAASQGPVWTVSEVRGGRVTLLRWRAQGAELVQVTCTVAPEGLSTWFPATAEDAERETREQTALARSRRGGAVPPTNPQEAMEAELNRRGVVKSRGPVGTMRDLREVRDVLRAEGIEAIKRAMGVLTNLIDVAERAEAHLSELYGPAFAAWRCDKCGEVVSDAMAGRLFDCALSVSDLSQQLGVAIVRAGADVTTVHCVSCGADMRHVLCRVTADSPRAPDAGTVAPDATPTGGGGD